eukprot:CAMPEP_0180388476 /NCGR_PEP_ID=MMETSP0989-20121125/30841_1 /TAXON_ID=697907 /ORGANISM="non described non described, Strain CCMP2293" /LENGTH=58 /DNA_ID=CAMNT_0022389505 /DNA_START=126 /DNA_END=298 /DNA_ORIENTATION=-
MPTLPAVRSRLRAPPGAPSAVAGAWGASPAPIPADEPRRLSFLTAEGLLSLPGDERAA